MGIFANAFTWWNGASWGTMITSRRNGEEVGRDDAGNVYFRHRKDPARRWVIYDGSNDSSRVWARVVADAVTVDPDAIPWLLLEIVGAVPGTTGDGKLTPTTFIQRVNTVGGLADPTTCSEPSRVGATVLVPYQADYVFYRAQGHR